MKKNYYVWYNCKLMAEYKSIKGALNYIKRKGLKDDINNILQISDNLGNEYNPINGISVELEEDLPF